VNGPKVTEKHLANAWNQIPIPHPSSLITKLTMLPQVLIIKVIINNEILNNCSNIS